MPDYKRNRAYKRPGYHACARMVGGDAAKALVAVRKLKRMINVEYKNVNVTFVTDPNTTGSVQILTSIAVGDDNNDREGRSVRAVSLRTKGHIRLNSSATITQVRLLIVRDNLGTTTRPTIADMFADVATFLENKNTLGTPQVNSRFTTFMDKFVLLDQIKQSQVEIDHYVKLDHHVLWTGPAATDEGKGQIYLFIISSEVTNDPIVEVTSQFKWIDN